MTESGHEMKDNDPEMYEILEKMLANDENITARAVIRLHSSLKAASSITRSQARSKLLAQYQERQDEYRRWRGRVKKQSSANTVAALEQKERRIAELEGNVQMLAASHSAMIRAVGAMGGFSKWAQFYEEYRDIRNKLVDLGALSENITAIHSGPAIQTPPRKKKWK